MRIRTFGGLVSAGALVLLALWAVPAPAQTTTTPGYPGTTNTTQPSTTTTTQTLGSVSSGKTLTGQACGFQPGSTVTETLDGNAAGTDTVGSDGCVTLTISVISVQALGTPMYAAIMPVRFFAQAKTAQVSINGRTVSGLVGTNTLATSGTGSNGAPRTVDTIFTITAPSSSALPHTGMMVLKWMGAALGLVAIGALIVIADRRRAKAAQAGPGD